MGIRRGSISTPIIADGLAFNMDAANRASYIPDATTSFNTTNLSQSGSLENEVGFLQPPISSSCWNFDGTDDYLDVGSIAIVNSVSNFSFSCWIKTPSFSVNGYVLGRTGTSNIYESVLMYVKTTGQIVFNVYYGAQQTVNSISLNTWTHIACVYDGSLSTNNLKGKIYINGVLETNTTIGGTIPSATGPGLGTNFNIGARGKSTGPANFFTGNIANVQIYNRSLSSTEVLHNYNALKSRFE